MPGKLRFRWTRPFWITREFTGSYQLGTLAGEVLEKWVNGFRLKPYYRPMPRNLFEQPDDETVVDKENRELVPDPALPDSKE